MTAPVTAPTTAPPKTAPPETALQTDVPARPAARPKITVVGPGFHLLGGLSVYTCRLANALTADFDVSVIELHRVVPTRLYPGAARAGRPLTSLRYDPEVHTLATIDWYGSGLIGAVRALRRERPDLLLLQWWTAASLHTYLVLAVAAKVLRVPVALEFHETQDTGEAAVPLVARYCRLLLPRLLRLASGAVVHHHHDRALLQRTYGARRWGRLAVETAPHGPYDHLASAESAAPSPGGSDGLTRLLFFGLIRPYKGLEDLVAAFDRLTPEQAAGFRLTVVGETWEDWQLPAERIAASRHRDRITFVNRYVSDAEAAAYFDDADAIVLPYRRGSASGPLQIAMSKGLNVVLYAVGGLVDAVVDYPGAVPVRPGDVEGLREALLTLPEHRDDRYPDPHSWQPVSAALRRLVTRFGSP